MAYITKAKDGLVQLWNNKPSYNETFDIWIGWIIEGEENEVGIDITGNDTFRNKVCFENSPLELKDL